MVTIQLALHFYSEEAARSARQRIDQGIPGLNPTVHVVGILEGWKGEFGYRVESEPRSSEEAKLAIDLAGVPVR